ncbi:MAG: type II secretion system minor pseudopilin GspI [Gammaproteobacteria bacterium]
MARAAIMMRARAARGFTLLEVLIALALTATTLGGVLALTRGAIANHAYLERRLFADWVASNVLNAWRLEPGDSDAAAATQRGREVVLGRAFAWTLTIAAPVAVPPADDDAPRDDSMLLRVVDVTVSDDESGATPLAQRRFAWRVPAT